MLEGTKAVLKQKRSRTRPPLKKGTKLNAGKIAFLALGMLAVVGAVWGLSSKGALYLLSVDGKEIGYVKDPSLHQEIVQHIMEDESMKLGAEVKLCSSISLQKSHPEGDCEPLTEPELRDKLQEVIRLTAPGFVICVNGTDVVALKCKEDAEGTLSDLRGQYISAVVSRNARVDEVLIKEKVSIEEKEVPTDIFRGREEASRVLSRGTDKIIDYTVKRGDSLWAIAAANHLTVDDLRRANPKVSGDLIREGDSLSLVVPDPYVTLNSKETIVSKVSIPYNVQVTSDDSLWPWQETVLVAGKSGTKEITQVIERENGKEVKRTTVSEKVLSQPITRKLVRGTKQVPPMGSDELAWPVQGRITSNYGWRWGRFHQGVDIGAATGTAIIAADSGMVSFAGWNGGYGNFVRIEHGEGNKTCYGHLSRFAVKVGDKVSKGDVIGYVGSTGVSTGPHLHFEVWRDGKHKDPLTFYK